MHVTLRLPSLLGLSLLAAAAGATAESPMPEPIAPAVIGRPLDQIAPARPARQKPVATKPKRTKPVAIASKAVAAPVAVTAAQAAAPAQHVAKQAVDDRADLSTPVANDVGKGAHFARKPLGPGAYFGSKYQAMVRKYYESHPASGRAKWSIGEPVPAGAAVTGVPDNLRAALPRLPPGHQYVQVDGEVVLVAVQSRMVVDGISRGAR